MHRIALAGALCAAGLVGAFVGVALGQPPRMPPAESKGFRTEMLATLDLANEIEGMAGRQLRMRRITVEPGGQFGLHDHRDRPGLFYIQDGTITEYRKAPRPASTVPDRPLLWAFAPGTGRRTEGQAEWS